MTARLNVYGGLILNAVRCAAAWSLFLLVLPTGRPLFGQQAQPSTYNGFDGQNVTEVEVAAGPGVDTEAMRQFVQLQARRPFSSEVLRQSVRSLQETHRFSEVQVSLEPEPQGLRVLFILQPAFYVGVIEFPGTGTRFPYSALLQATNIPEQSPYFDDLIAQARQGLLDYFQKHGFFEAAVQSQLQHDDAHRIINVVFQCSLRDAARIGSINFTGISEPESAQMRAALRSAWAKLKRVSLKPGQKYSEPYLTKSMDFMRERLRGDDRLAPSIRLGAKRYDPASNRVDITFDVVPGPKVSIRVAGAHVSHRTLRRLIPIYEEGSADQDLVDEGGRNLKAYFQTKGYFDVTVDSKVDRAGGAVNVAYEISRGIRHREKGVYFAGNHYFPDRQLQAHVSIKNGFLFFHGKFSQELLDKSVKALTQLYKDQGFESVSIQPKVEDFDPEVDVTFQIEEGPQDKVGTMEVRGIQTEPLDALTRDHPIGLKPGTIFSRKTLEKDRNELLAAYLDAGYPNATVRSAAAPAAGAPHRINITYSVNEGPRTRITDVVYLGEQHTKPGFIAGITGKEIKSGQPLSEGKSLQAESDLYDLGIFDWASVGPLRPVVNQTGEEVLVKVHESALNTMDVGGGIEVIPRSGNIPINAVVVPGIPPISLGNKFSISQQSYVGPRFTFDFARHNLRGKAETATIGTILSRLDQRGFFTYADPHLAGSSWSSLLSLSAERTTENSIFTAHLGQASFQIEKALDRKHTKNLIARYSFQRTDLSKILIPNLVLPEDQRVRLSTFDGEYIRDSRDNPLDAHHGVYQTLDLGVTSKALGASADFLRFFAQASFYTPVTPWLTWANNFRLGLGKPFSGSHIPLSERFFTGGADSLRGFPINGAGPQRAVPVCTNPSNPSTCTLISVPVGGNMVFIFNSEARFPLPIRHGLGGVIFYDGGNVYSNINVRQFADDFTHSVGVGIRYETPVGPVRFDFGYRLTSVPGVKANQYFVTLGQSF